MSITPKRMKKAELDMLLVSSSLSSRDACLRILSDVL